jgi:hypothetical protein
VTTRAVVTERRDGTFEVSVLVKIGRDCWRSAPSTPARFDDEAEAIEYGKKHCDEVI